MGRPLHPIDWEQFDKLCLMQCTLSEIAAWFKCSEDTIENAVRREKKERFSDYFKAKREVGKIALRRKQYQMAVENGNTTMLVWLGKNYLSQTDRNDIKLDAEISGPDKKPVEISLQDAVKTLLSSEDGLETLNRLESICAVPKG